MAANTGASSDGPQKALSGIVGSAATADAEKAERDRLRPITDEISGDSVEEDAHDDSFPDQEPLRGGPSNRGLAGVGLAPARAAIQLPGKDVRLDLDDRADGGMGSGGARGQRSPDRLLEHSGQSGVSG